MRRVNELYSPVSKWLVMLLPGMIVFTGLLMTAWASYYVYINGAAKDELRFERSVADLEADITAYFRVYDAFLYAARAHIESNPSLDREQFQQFIFSIRMEELYEGTQGIGYAKRYVDTPLTRIEADIRRLGHSTPIKVVPSNERAEVFPIIFLEPQTERNRTALGFDMFSEQIRREAMERARDTGRTAMSAKVTLVQETETDKQPGFLIYTPVYAPPANPVTTDTRRRQLLGFVYSPFRAVNFFETFHSREEPTIDFTVYDGTEKNSDNILFALNTNKTYTPWLQTTRQIEIAGRTWTISYANRAATEVRSERNLTVFVALFGIGLTLFLYATTRSQITGRIAAETSEIELLKSQMALQASEERFRLLIEGAKDYAIIMLDTAGRISSWNVGAQQLFGYGESEILRKSYAVFFTAHAKQKGTPKRELQQAIKQGSSEFERQFLHKNGEPFWVSGITTAVYDQYHQLKGYALIARDVTARRRTEETLRKTEALTQSILSSLTAHLAVLDRNGVIIAVNEAWKAITYPTLIGTVPSLRVGDNYLQSAYSSKRSDHEYPSRAAAGIEAVLRGEKEFYTLEYPQAFVPADEARWFELNVTPLKSDVGGVVLSHTDITERKRLEHQKDEFISIASHELKTPITSAKAYTQVLVKLFEKIQDTRALTILKKVDNQIAKVADLINDLLDTSKIEAGRLELNVQKLDYIDVAKETIEAVQLSTATHRIEVVFDKPMYIVGDRDRLGQVLTNLLTNAIKYSPRSDRVMVRIKVVDKEVVTEVEDFGIGIKTEEQANIFDRFFRASSPTSHTFPGLGLGLYITAEIVKRLGGRIWLKSEPGKGTTFFVAFPKVPA